MSHQHQKPLPNPMSSSSSQQAPAIQPALAQKSASDLLRRLQETTIAALRASNNTMDSHHSYGGSSSKATSPDDKIKGYEQSAVFDGLFPRIETRGQSKGSSKKSSGKKKEGKSSHQYASTDITATTARDANGSCHS
ncbi:hypothetical protein CPLU01_09435 [Colletotrichum plurivorum]|uniref:Uncharacterized protein n=1 Tax=Colletotrichum plurivorum TaxID=2175906 RepID=A0A8H6NBK7_9PEZI|nr:hypothetical protein CPLU01_09435 [Colletotrichum plurivorum]